MGRHSFYAYGRPDPTQQTTNKLELGNTQAGSVPPADHERDLIPAALVATMIPAEEFQVGGEAMAARALTCPTSSAINSHCYDLSTRDLLFACASHCDLEHRASILTEIGMAPQWARPRVR